MTVCERVFRNFKYELPSSPLKRFEVTRELVEQPEKVLEALLAESQKEERSVSRQLVEEYARRFYDSYKLRLNFSEAAIERISRISENDGIPVRDVCAERFKDYQFGLKLIFQNTGQSEFLMDTPNVDEPDKIISEWVVASYRSKDGNTATEPPPLPPIE
jgi:hypothetical protein